MSILRRWKRSRRDHARLDELLQINRAKLYELMAETEQASGRSRADFVAVLGEGDNGVDLHIVDRAVAVREFSEMVKGIDRVPAPPAFTVLGACGTAVSCNVLHHREGASHGGQQH